MNDYKTFNMNFNKILIWVFAAAMFIGCNDDYIDPISKVDPGPDEEAPTVIIKYPLEGTMIQVMEPTTSVTIQYEASDDIRLTNVSVEFDGNEVESRSQFVDYRRLVAEVTVDGIENGMHTVEVTATDSDGKVTSELVNFEKVNAYNPRYDGEVLYMPFDGDYSELIAFSEVTVIGNPKFAGESVLDMGDAYAGAEGAYLTLDGTPYHNDEFSASFWLKINEVPDRAGILVMGPEDVNNPTAQNNRTSGFRFFRENAAGMQRFKLNVGTGASDSWFDGGAAADVDPTTDEWVHFAFTITSSEAAVYINGQVVREGTFDGVDWTGCDVLSIMSGAPRFTGWNHLSDQSYMDELRLFNRALSQSDIMQIIADDKGGGTGYTPKFDGEMFYASFDGSYQDLVSGAFMTEVGTPTFAGEGKAGSDAYMGAADSYLTMPSAGLTGDEFSAAFWYKVNAEPDRAGILVLGPPDPDNPEAQNKRTSGFRFFRENAGGEQRFKLNAGNGDADSWFDGGDMADIDPTTGDWVHFAFAIGLDKCTVYIDGEIVSQNDFAGIDWAECDEISIMSGVPHFTGWGHLSDLSVMDELRFFDKELSQEEVKAVMDDAN